MSESAKHFSEMYNEREIILTKEMIRVMGLDTRQVYMCFADTQWPSIIHSLSARKVKMLLSARSVAYTTIVSEKISNVTVKLSFVRSKNTICPFELPATVNFLKPYSQSRDFIIIDMVFDEAIPEEMLDIIGSVVEANQNFALRTEDRIVISPESKKLLRLLQEQTHVYFQGVPRRCVLRDLSFSGGKIILIGLSHFLAGKKLMLKIAFYDPFETFNITGSIVAVSNVQKFRDLVCASIKFDEQSIPFSYKSHINNYLSTIKRKVLGE